LHQIWNICAHHELADMQRFYFHHYLNGRLTEDRRGLRFWTADDACAHAIRRTPTALGKAVHAKANTYVATEVSDGKRTFCVIRGNIVIERR
jgi:hypothetical protein